MDRMQDGPEVGIFWRETNVLGPHALQSLYVSILQIGGISHIYNSGEIM